MKIRQAVIVSSILTTQSENRLLSKGVNRFDDGKDCVKSLASPWERLSQPLFFCLPCNRHLCTVMACVVWLPKVVISMTTDSYSST